MTAAVVESRVVLTVACNGCGRTHFQITGVAVTNEALGIVASWRCRRCHTWNLMPLKVLAESR